MHKSAKPALPIDGREREITLQPNVLGRGRVVKKANTKDEALTPVVKKKEHSGSVECSRI